MKEKLRQGFQKIKNTIFSSTARRLIVAWGIIVILFGIYGVFTKLDLRAIGFYIAGVFAAPVGLWLAWRRTHALQEQAKADAKKADALIEQAQSHAFQSETDSKRQFSEAFSRAVELLGNNNPAVRQGAIHALAGLARENPEQHRTIFNIITSYIRERSPNPPAEDTSKKLPVDIEAAMLEIVNRDIEPEKSESRGYDLSNAYLRGVGIHKPNADLHRFTFRDTDFSESWLDNVDLSGANVSLANLSGAQLWEANLSDAALFSANLSGAGLREANLSNAVLRFSDLSGADLSGADLSRADLLRAKLHGVDLSAAKNLTQEQINQAEGDEETKLPSELTPPDKWINPPPSDD